MSHLELASPEQLGFDSQRFERACALLEGWTRSGTVPGGAMVVGRHGKMIAPQFFGRMGPEPGAEPMRDDALFLMASITKPIVYLAAMTLVEHGLLNLTDRVTRYIPEFAAHHKDETLLLHLFTHTSGLPDMLPNNAELRRSHAPLETFVEHAIRDTVPLFAPGSQLSYQSVGTLITAEIVRRVSGMKIAEFLDSEIFKPLGLSSLALGSSRFDRARLVRVETPAYHEPEFGWNSRYWQELGSPWGGLFSAPAEFAVLCHLMLNDGSVVAAGGRPMRIVSPATVAAMTCNWLDRLPDVPEPTRRTRPWGLGWRLNHPGTDDSWGDLLGPRVFGHTGATGTQVWMDPDTGVFCLLLTSALRERQPWLLVNLSNAIAASLVSGG
ncbi:MAG TPA: serine hydrolase domain-containing protein [Pirellulales bacterium]|jgi:CubicO group peptidase (beta-lactamase class C family)|nr:serine hydrolase domain-containing protein [Pirellulales bacterium]